MPANVLEETTAEATSDCTDFVSPRAGLKTSENYFTTENELNLMIGNTGACGEYALTATFVKAR